MQPATHGEITHPAKNNILDLGTEQFFEALADEKFNINGESPEEPDEIEEDELELTTPPNETMAPPPALDIETPWENEKRYTYLVEKCWLPPLPESMLVERREQGVLCANTLLSPAGQSEPQGSKSLYLSALSTPTTPVTENLSGRFESLSTVQELTGVLKDAAEGLDAWSDESNNWRGAKSLRGIDKLLRTSKAFAKASVGLGLFGSALGIILIFAGEEDDTEVILKAIERLGSRVDSLEQLMVAKFEQLENRGELNAARTQISDALGTLRSLMRLVDQYRTTIAGSADRHDIESRLLDFDRGQVQRSVDALFSQATGGDLRTNILKATYDASFGDITAVCDVGNTLFSFAAFGLTADALISSLANSRNSTPSPQMADAAARNAQRLYGPNMNGILKAWDQWQRKCRT